jgi:hypothetical protein
MDDHTVKHIAWAFYFAALGSLFILVPWSRFWPSTIDLPPFLAPVYASSVVRGLVSGFGVVLLLAAFIEIYNAFSHRQ